MIAQIRGRVLRRELTVLIVEVGGIGMRVQCTPAALALGTVGVEVVLPTTLVIREDHWQLFGFRDDEERSTFESLQSVTGIGPRIALAAVSTLDAATIAQAIANEDHALLTRIPGIGKKGAARMCIELKDRFAAVAMPPVGVTTSWQADVRDALIGLGWNQAQAESAVEKVAAAEPDSDVASALRSALQMLGRR